MSNAPSVTLLLGRFVWWRVLVMWMAVAAMGVLLWVLTASHRWETHFVWAAGGVLIQGALSIWMIRSWNIDPSYLRFDASQGVVVWQWRPLQGHHWQVVQDLRVVMDAQHWVWVHFVTADGRRRLHCLSRQDAGAQLWHVWRSVLTTGAS
ncbi:MAG: hypothetical protein RLZZ397_828 [Pseudomonadota bacterium]|jgi:hypothetical protein